MSLDKSQKRIRLFFILLVPFLFLQFYFAKKFGEPYPAILFPGFGGVPENMEFPHDFLRFSIHAYEGDDSVIMSMDEVFAPFPEKVLFMPMVFKINTLPFLLTYKEGNRKEQDLMEYLEAKVKASSKLDQVDRIEFKWHKYRATAVGSTNYMGVADKRIIFLTDKHDQ